MEWNKKAFVRSFVLIYESQLIDFIQNLNYECATSDTPLHSIIKRTENKLLPKDIFEKNPDEEEKGKGVINEVPTKFYGDLIIFMLHYFSIHHHGNKLKAIVDQLYLFINEPTSLRKILVESACRICNFLYQTDSKRWSKNRTKVAEDIVHSIIGYYRTHPNENFLVNDVIRSAGFGAFRRKLFVPKSEFKRRKTYVGEFQSKTILSPEDITPGFKFPKSKALGSKALELKPQEFKFPKCDTPFYSVISATDFIDKKKHYSRVTKFDDALRSWKVNKSSTSINEEKISDKKDRNEGGISYEFDISDEDISSQSTTSDEDISYTSTTSDEDVSYTTSSDVDISPFYSVISATDFIDKKKHYSRVTKFDDALRSWKVNKSSTSINEEKISDKKDRNEGGISYEFDISDEDISSQSTTSDEDISYTSTTSDEDVSYTTSSDVDISTSDEDDKINEEVQQLLSDIDEPLFPKWDYQDLPFVRYSNTKEDLSYLNKYIQRKGTDIILLIDKTYRIKLQTYAQSFLDRIHKDHLKNTTSQVNRSQNADHPTWFGITNPLSSFVGREQQLKEVHNQLKQNDIVVICGLFGVGKTALAVQYIYKYYDGKNDFVIFIDASTHERVMQSFKNTHKKLGLKIDDENDVELLVEEVYEYVGEKGIFVFDNAENYRELEEYLPLSITCKPLILITSPNVSKKEWLSRRFKREQLFLGSFENIEAKTFVKTSFKRNVNFDDEDIEQLIRNLNNFPLVLTEAMMYYNTQKYFKFKYNTYLHYKVNFHTMFETTKSIFEKIKADVDYGEQALDTLNIISYFAPNNIPVNIFLHELDKETENKMAETINVLRKYALVTLNNEMLNTNGLIQEVLRSKLKVENQELKYLQKVSNLLLKYLNDEYSLEIYSPHIISFWKHSYKYSDRRRNNFINDYDNVFIEYFNMIVQKGSYQNIKSVVDEIKINRTDKLEDIITGELKERIISLQKECSWCKEDIIKFLIQDYWRPLHYAAIFGFFNLVKALLENDVFVDCRSMIYRYTPLHLASLNGQHNIVSLLVMHDADVNAKTNYVVEQSGMDISLFGTSRFIRNTLVPRTILRPFFTIGEMITNSVSIKIEHLYYATPLHFASLYNHLDVVMELLNAKNIDINTQTRGGDTALHLASEKGNVEIVKVLVSNNADVKLLNSSKKTASALAKNEDIKDIFFHRIRPRPRHRRALGIVGTEIKVMNTVKDVANKETEKRKQLN